MSRNPMYSDVVTSTVERIREQQKVMRDPFFTALREELVNQYYPVYFVQDDFTVATLVRVQNQKTEFVGVSKRNAGDPKVPIRGKSLSLSRAIRAFVQARIRAVPTVADVEKIESAVQRFADSVDLANNAHLTKA